MTGKMINHTDECVRAVDEAVFGRIIGEDGGATWNEENA